MRGEGGSYKGSVLSKWLFITNVPLNKSPPAKKRLHCRLLLSYHYYLLDLLLTLKQYNQTKFIRFEMSQ